MKKVIPGLIISFLLCWTYWYAVMATGIDYQNKGNIAGYQYGFYLYYGENDKADSVLELRKHYYQKADNTFKLIPKFLLP